MEELRWISEAAVALGMEISTASDLGLSFAALWIQHRFLSAPAYPYTPVRIVKTIEPRAAVSPKIS